jgi:hypothetical protein
MCLLSYIDIFSCYFVSDYKPDMNKTPVLLYPAVVFVTRLSLYMCLWLHLIAYVTKILKTTVLFGYI